MTYGEPIFELAVYRKSPAQMYQEQDEAFEKMIRPSEQRLTHKGIDYRNSDAYMISRSWFYASGRSPYPYNQIIGWIQILASYELVLGEYWKVNAMRITRGSSRKPVTWMGKAFDAYLLGHETNEQIVARVLKELQRLTCRSAIFAGRYIDTVAFERVAKVVDWQVLIGPR